MRTLVLFAFAAFAAFPALASKPPGPCPLLVAEYAPTGQTAHMLLAGQPPTADLAALPTVALVNGQAFLLYERAMEASDTGVLSAPALRLTLGSASSISYGALNHPRSVAVVRSEGKLPYFYVVGERKRTLHAFFSQDDLPYYHSQMVPLPLQPGEKAESVSAWEDEEGSALFVSTNTGRVYRVALLYPGLDSNVPRLSQEFDLVATHAFHGFQVLSRDAILSIDSNRSIWLQRKQGSEWLGRLPGQPLAFSAYEKPWVLGSSAELANRIVIWASVFENNAERLLRWDIQPGTQPDWIRPSSFASKEVPLQVQAQADPDGDEIVLLVGAQNIGRSVKYNLHLRSGDSWVQPQWWSGKMPGPRQTPPELPKRELKGRPPQKAPPQPPLREIHHSLSRYFDAAEMDTPLALDVAFKLLVRPAEVVGDSSLFWVRDLGLVTHVLDSAAGDAMAWLYDADIFSELLESDLQGNFNDPAFDARDRQYPLDQRQYVMQMLLHQFARVSSGRMDVYESLRFIEDEIEALPGRSEQPLYDILQHCLDKLEQQRRYDGDPS